MWRSVPATALQPVPGGWDGPGEVGTVFLSTEYDAGWELRGDVATPGGGVRVGDQLPDRRRARRIRHTESLPARMQAVLLTLIWLVALWATRKPVAR